MAHLITTLKETTVEMATWLYPKYQLNFTDSDRQLLLELAFAPIHTAGNSIVISKREAQLAEHPTVQTFLKDLRICVMQDTISKLGLTKEDTYTVISVLIEDYLEYDDLNVCTELVCMAFLNMHIYALIRTTHPTKAK